MEILFLMLVFALAVAAMLAIYVNDWSRDFTTNRAGTSEAGRRGDIPPLEVTCDFSRLQQAIEAIEREDPSWSQPHPPRLLPDDSKLLTTVEGATGAVQLHLVHRSMLFRFADDVWIVVLPNGPDAWRLHMESRSRVGIGDLGQNPRNLRELQTELSERLR